MMQALLRKETRQLAPFLFLTGFFVLMDWLYLLAMEFPDQLPMGKLIDQDFSQEGLVTAAVLGFAISSGLLVTETSEKTLDFLDGLPVGRWSIFWAKFIAAFGLMLLLPVSRLGAALVFQSLSMHSLDNGYHWDVLVKIGFLEAWGCFVILSVLMVLSFFRAFALLILGLVFWLYTLLNVVHVPGVRLLNVFALADPIFEGQRWVMPWGRVGATGMMGMVCLAVAGGLFAMLGDRTMRLGAYWQRMQRRLGWGAAGVLGQLWFGFGAGLIFVVWIGLAVFHFADEEAVRKPAFQNWETSRLRTKHYDFLFRENLAAEAMRLGGGADEVHERVRGFFEAESPGRLVVDMSGQFQRHVGQAYWKKIRLALDPTMDLDTLRSILGHETAHVYVDHLSESRLDHVFDSARFLHEGLASYVEYHLFLAPEKLEGLRRVAALMRARNEVILEELASDQQLSRKRDRNLVYPLGEIFVSALIEHQGSNAPSRILRAFARKDAPEDLRGMVLWEDAFQSCGYNLPEVLAQFYMKLDQEVVAHRDWINSVPRLLGAVEEERDRIGIRAVAKAPARGRIVCRFRAGVDDTEDSYFTAYAGADGICWVPKSWLTERSYWYQLGLEGAGTSLPVYESWVEVYRGN